MLITSVPGMAVADSYSSSESLFSLFEDEKEKESVRSSPLRSVFKKFNLLFGSPGEKTDLPTSCQGFHTLLCMPVEFNRHRVHTSIFGVSIESMQCTYDSRGNSVPAILLLLQKRLYARGGLQTEGIFRVCAAKCRLEYGREQLNKGVVPDDIDVHCLAGLIKMWFRELPWGLLDTLIGPGQPMEPRSYVECRKLLKLLPPTEAGLLDWVVSLMADVAQEEEKNKMSAHNLAVVFTPNFMQSTIYHDLVTANKNVLPVINFLEILIVKTMKDRVRVHFPCLKDAFRQEDIEDKLKAEQEIAEKQETESPLLGECTIPKKKNYESKKSDRKKRNWRVTEQPIYFSPKFL